MEGKASASVFVLVIVGVELFPGGAAVLFDSAEDAFAVTAGTTLVCGLDGTWVVVVTIGDPDVAFTDGVGGFFLCEDFF